MPQSRRRPAALRTAAAVMACVGLLGALAGCSHDDEGSADPESESASAAPPSSVNLSPMTPEQARQDTGRIYDNGCYAKREDSTPPAPGECVYGDPGGRPVVLFGDSHAAQWFEAMAALAEEQGWRLLPVVKMACPPGGEPVYNAYLGREYTECADWHADALRLVESERPDLVVVATRAAYYRIVDDGQTLSVQESADSLGDALAADLGRFSGMGATTVLVRDTPVPGFDVPDCVEAEGADACTYPFDDSLPDDRYQLSAARETDTPVADVNAEVCGVDLSRCLAVAGGLITYRDDDHLAATFGATLAEPLGTELPAGP